MFNDASSEPKWGKFKKKKYQKLELFNFYLKRICEIKTSVTRSRIINGSKWCLR